VNTLIHWFRRDLRVDDNTSLARVARDGDRVVTVFILDDHYLRESRVGPARFRFLRESLEVLSLRLAAAGGRLLLRPGPAREALPRLLEETGAGAVYANAEIGPYPERRDRETAAAVEARGAKLRLFPDELLVAPDAIASESGAPYTVYTPFLKRWLAADKADPVPAPRELDSPEVTGVPLARVRAWRDLPETGGPRGGSSAAQDLLEGFFRGPAARYGEDRDRPDRPGTSRLSPHLHFGTISARTVRAAAGRAGKDASAGERESLRKFVAELAWREFFHHVLHHFPRVASESFRPEFDRLEWREDAAGLDAWKTGRTGYPLVDAAMRELATTHWMHNRGRMVAASFLTKDLHVHWRVGEAWFENELADADLANNNGGWQWAAGSGADAAPYFRVFNPVLQSRRFDPEGRYIRAFVPELARVPAAKIHEPWTMTEAEQEVSRCSIGVDYPAPIVDHGRERAAALDLFSRSKK
jgi:deoxyribodipyrimidine photo-lyase